MSKMRTPIHSITPFTLLDYPDKTACILWFTGCNMRCPYCYNPDIVLGKGRISLDDALTFLQSRRGLLEGVVLSGGECTQHRSIFPLLQAIREMGFAAKIDTNGSRPATLHAAIKNRLVDYVALDFKAPENRYWELTHSRMFKEFEKSLSVLIASEIPFEVRTTVHDQLLREDEIRHMADYLGAAGYRGNYYIQHAVNDVPTLSTPGYSGRYPDLESYSDAGVQVVVRE